MHHKWLNVKDQEPPTDGRFILCHRQGTEFAFSASYRTFHPNAPGKKVWRDPVGHKVYFTHWKLLVLPKA